MSLRSHKFMLQCVLIRLSNGKEITSYIPGEGHSLQVSDVMCYKLGMGTDFTKL